MLNINKARKYPNLFRRLVGISPQDFDKLIATLEKHYMHFQRKRLSRRERERDIGAGAKFKLSLEQRVFMTLFFLRHYTTFALLGFLFDLHESNAYRNVEIMKEFLKEYIPLPNKVKKKKISSLDELLEEIPHVELLIDGTEQERNRPKDKEERKTYYSGKKKRHSIKSQIVVERDSGLIVDVSSGWEGSMHDLRIFKETNLVEKYRGHRVKVWVDSGYEGIEKLVSGWEVNKPKKKPKGRELRDVDRVRNKEINKVRVKIEHKIRAMKRYQVFGGRYRGRVKGYEDMVEVIAGLVNMEEMMRMGMMWDM
ncbi:MAG: transposase family protein [Caldimicrobium sp.]